MRNILFVIFFIPVLAFSQKRQDTINNNIQKQKIEMLSKSFNELEQKYDYQLKINEQTLNSISTQIGATSYNLSVFGIFFGILAIGLGIYITWVERKIVKLRDENIKLLKETIDTKNEVVAINDLIQKDIYGLFLKIKREETIHILNRLTKIPEDISNLSEELLSRELIPEDFILLKKAYLNLKPIEKKDALFKLKMDYDELYLILFFQHFLDLSIKDEQINTNLINFYSKAINCAFENDILKSTEDFMKAIVDLGYQSKSNEINSFLEGIAKSEFKNLNSIYLILFNSLKLREDHFKFYTLINNENEIRLVKINYGNLLIKEYENNNSTISENQIFEDIKKIKLDLKREEDAKRVKEDLKKQNSKNSKPSTENVKSIPSNSNKNFKK